MSVWQSILFALCFLSTLVLPALLVAGEFALVALRYGAVGNAAEEFLKKHVLLRHLVENGDRTARVIRFTKTACHAVTGMMIFVLVSLLWPDWLNHWQGWALTAGGLLLYWSVQYLFIELVPRALALHNPTVALRLVAPVLFASTLLSYPFLRILRPAKRMLYGLLKIDIEEDLSPLDVEVQIRALGEDTQSLTPAIRKIIARTLQLNDLDVHDALLPRNLIQFMDLNDSYEENLNLARQTGHTRFPLCEEDLDHCVGIIHIKDLFRQPSKRDLRALRRNIVSVRVEDRLDSVLSRLLGNRVHMALVQDAFGGTVGIITLEAILEQLVGDIQDEFDNEEALISEVSEQTYQIAGLAPIHEIEGRLGIDLGDEEVSTLGGLITSELGRIPEKDEELLFRNYRITVREVDERRVISATLEILPGESGDHTETKRDE